MTKLDDLKLCIEIINYFREEIKELRKGWGKKVRVRKKFLQEQLKVGLKDFKRKSKDVIIQ